MPESPGKDRKCHLAMNFLSFPRSCERKRRHGTSRKSRFIHPLIIADITDTIRAVAPAPRPDKDARMRRASLLLLLLLAGCASTPGNRLSFLAGGHRQRDAARELSAAVTEPVALPR